MKSRRQLMIANVSALICAIWFLSLGWVWVYFANIIFVFPVAILGYFLWRRGRGEELKLLNKIVGWMLVAGVVVSVGTLIAFTLAN